MGRDGCLTDTCSMNQSLFLRWPMDLWHAKKSLPRLVHLTSLLNLNCASRSHSFMLFLLCADPDINIVQQEMILIVPHSHLPLFEVPSPMFPGPYKVFSQCLVVNTSTLDKVHCTWNFMKQNWCCTGGSIVPLQYIKAVQPVLLPDPHLSTHEWLVCTPFCLNVC